MRILFFISVVSLSVLHTFASESNGTLGENINGGGLIKLGRKLHKPMLTLIGMAIQNLHPCGEWTPWTSCDATGPGYFGSQTRTRSCIESDGSNTKPGLSEFDNRICEGHCPVSYNFTSHGFCLKLNTSGVHNDQAAKQCESEGGYLIHIDTQQKYDDVKSLISGFGTHTYIDGQRKDVSSPWTYRYGSKTAFLNWHSGYPKHEKNYLCLALSSSQKLQFNYLCTENYPFICEILQY